MKKSIFFFVLLVLLVFPLTTFAHSGRTDSSGGHYDYSTGKYHYHHGFSAHQHKNGICPFDFSNDNVLDDLNSNSYIKKNSYFNYTIDPVPKENKTNFSTNKLQNSDNISILELTLINSLKILGVSITAWILIYFLIKLLILNHIFKNRYKGGLLKSNNIMFMLFLFVSVWLFVAFAFFENYILANLFFISFLLIAFKLWYYKNDKLYDEINEIRW